MIFFHIFYTFLVIGAFTFGGGYSMVALIQREVVDHHAWITSAEFTDLLAISQMTPGPIGINTATYAGYTAVINAGYSQWAAVCGSLLASLAVIAVPVTLVLVVSSWLTRHRSEPRVASVLRVLRLAVIGLIAAAALQLMPAVFSTTPKGNVHLLGHSFSLYNLLIFVAVFALSLWRKASPIFLIVGAGLVGLAVYSF